ncbi:MAG: HlyD family efflux transporter periplasmic adaptor subunit [Bacteroidetes bacterium]|nr:HlyD family efflux transporter periplasmic adaptor subunit [Fibrella sp.]
MLNLSNHRVDEALFDHHPLKTLRALPQPNAGQRLARWLLMLVFVSVAVLFLPWRQTITGEGMVTALTPRDRPQTVQNAIAGRIERWAVQEGQLVKQGDTLLVISETKDDYFDPRLPQRLREQLTAKNSNQQATGAKIRALDGQMAALETGLIVKLQSARNKIRQARFKVTSDSADQMATQSFYKISRDRLDRYEKGHQDGLFSLTDIESRRLKVQEDYAKVIVQEAKLAAARQELTNAELELSNIRADYQEKLAKTRSDQGSALAYRADADGEIAKLQNKISSVAVRQGLYVIRAPQAGYVVRALRAGIGEIIKEGESVVTLQPAAPTLAVEVYVRAMDVPLIQHGRPVRLQFDGWPAIQFSGWPTVSVGTFGGEVVVIDAVGSTNGKYRLLVRAKPDDPAKPNQMWPAQLRPGSGVQGWVMLDDVPVWYELWRQLNGFPPNLKQEPGAGTNQEKTK